MNATRGEGFARFVLIGSALAFAGIGVAFLLAPAQLGAFVGLPVAGATADNDVRAVYGGLQVACGALLLQLARHRATLRTGLRAQLLLFSGLAIGRFVSWGVAGWPEPLALGLHAAEGIALVCGVLAWRGLAVEAD